MASEKIFNLPDTTDTPSTQKELAEKYGITKQTMSNYMRLAKAIPELEELVDTGLYENKYKKHLFNIDIVYKLCYTFFD